MGPSWTRTGNVGHTPELSAVHSDRVTKFLCYPAPQEVVAGRFEMRGAPSLFATHHDLGLGEQGGSCLVTSVSVMKCTGHRVSSYHMNESRRRRKQCSYYRPASTPRKERG